MVKKASKKSKVAAKKGAANVKKNRRLEPSGEPFTHTLDALLHTIRCIAQHEDELCTLLHDARRSGKMSAALLRDLRAVLEQLPANEYTDDLRAVQELASAA